jgi:membrane protein YqaA with SNARE-associated domain
MAVGLVMLIIVIVILGTLFGGIAGWIVGLFFTDTIMTTLDRFGVETMGMTMWQLGATLGFVSGFFKATKLEKSK